jgi:hypothetical protein
MKLPAWVKPVGECLAGALFMLAGATHWSDGFAAEIIVAGTAMLAAGLSTTVSPQVEAEIVQAIQAAADALAASQVGSSAVVGQSADAAKAPPAAPPNSADVPVPPGSDGA